MHELSVCQAVVAQVAAIARQHAAQVCSITLRIGPLSGVEASLVQQAFPLAAAATPFAHARVIVEAAPVRVRCRSCRRETPASPNRLVCAECGDWRTTLMSGDELLLASVELEPVAEETIHV